jgi:hypothetical protein
LFHSFHALAISNSPSGLTFAAQLIKVILADWLLTDLANLPLLPRFIFHGMVPYRKIIASIKTTNKIAVTIIAEIHIGENTNHQDQSIFPKTFSNTNTIVKSPQKPIPPELDDVLITLSFLLRGVIHP